MLPELYCTGITSIGDAGINPEKLELYKKAYRAGQPVKGNVMISAACSVQQQDLWAFIAASAIEFCIN